MDAVCKLKACVVRHLAEDLVDPYFDVWTFGEPPEGEPWTAWNSYDTDSEDAGSETSEGREGGGEAATAPAGLPTSMEGAAATAGTELRRAQKRPRDDDADADGGAGTDDAAERVGGAAGLPGRHAPFPLYVPLDAKLFIGVLKSFLDLHDHPDAGATTACPEIHAVLDAAREELATVHEWLDALLVRVTQSHPAEADEVDTRALEAVIPGFLEAHRNSRALSETRLRLMAHTTRAVSVHETSAHLTNDELVTVVTRVLRLFCFPTYDQGSSAAPTGTAFQGKCATLLRAGFDYLVLKDALRLCLAYLDGTLAQHRELDEDHDADDGATGDGATGDGAMSDGAADDGAMSDGAAGDGAMSDGAAGDGAAGAGAGTDTEVARVGDAAEQVLAELGVGVGGAPGIMQALVDGRDVSFRRLITAASRVMVRALEADVFAVGVAAEEEKESPTEPSETGASDESEGDDSGETEEEEEGV